MNKDHWVRRNSKVISVYFLPAKFHFWSRKYLILENSIIFFTFDWNFGIINTFGSVSKQMHLLISLLPYLFRLTLAFQVHGVETVGISIPDQLSFHQEANHETSTLNQDSYHTNLPPSARKLETEEKEIEFFDLFLNSGYSTTSFYYVADTSLYYSDYRKTRNKPHLYDLFHSWKTHLS